MMHRLLRLTTVVGLAAAMGCGPVNRCVGKQCPTGNFCDVGTGQCVGGFGGASGGNAQFDGGTAGGSAGAGGGSSAGGQGGGDAGGAAGGNAGGSGSDGGVPGETCSSAVAVGANAVLLDQTTFGMANDYGNTNEVGCAGAGGPDRVYRVTVPSMQRLTASVTPKDGGYDPSIALIAAPAPNCDASPRVCLVSDDSGGQTAVNTVTITNTAAAAQDYFVIIDGFLATSPGGPFDLSLATVTPPAGDLCSSATVLTPGTPVSSTLVGYANDYSSDAGNCGSLTATAGADRVFSLSIAAGHRAVVTVTPSAALDTSLSVVAAPAATCELEPRQCLASANNGGPGVSDSVVVQNPSASALDLLVIVDSAAGTPSTFSLSATSSVLVTGETCQLPTTLITGNPLSAETSAAFSNDYSGSDTNCANTNTTGADHVYGVSVPAMTRCTVTVTPSASFDPSLSIVAGAAAVCDAQPRVCRAAASSGGAGVAEAVSFNNFNSAAQTFFAIVDAAADGGTYGISATTGTLLVGDGCPNAPAPITADTTLSGLTTVGYVNDYGDGVGCRSFTGADRVFAVTVPAGGRLTAVATPTSSFDLSVSMVAGPASACEQFPRVCLVSVDNGGPTAAETALWVNRGAAAQTLFVVIDTYQPTVTGSFTLGLTFDTPAPPLPGDLCSNAVSVAGTTTLTGETTVGYFNDLSTQTTAGNGCTGYSNSGADKVYALTVLAGKSLSATVTPTGLDDAAIYLLPAPASQCGLAVSACLAGRDSALPGGAESLTWANTSTAAADVFLVVDQYFGTGYPYSLAITVQ